MAGDVATKCAEAGGDPNFCSHMAGIAQQFGMDWNSTIDRRTYPKIVAVYEEYTGTRYGGENLHAGKEISFSQFANSALEHWR